MILRELGDLDSKFCMSSAKKLTRVCVHFRHSHVKPFGIGSDALVFVGWPACPIVFRPPRHQGQNKSTKTAKPSLDSGATSAVVNNPMFPPSEGNVDKNSETVPFWKDRHFIIQCLILLATLVIARIYYSQLMAMTRSNELSRDALYSVQRAFVIPTKATTEISEYDTVNGIRRQKPLRLIEFTYHWENVGNTPAIGIVTAVGKVEQSDELSEQEFISTTIADKPSAKSALGRRVSLILGLCAMTKLFLPTHRVSRDSCGDGLFIEMCFLTQRLTLRSGVGK